jgi:hypothetical protein
MYNIAYKDAIERVYETATLKFKTEKDGAGMQREAMLCMRTNEASLPLNIHPAMCILMAVCIPDDDSTRDTRRKAGEFLRKLAYGRSF